MIVQKKISGVIITILLSALFAKGLHAQPPTPDYEVPAQLQRKYKRDAARLALRIAGRHNEYRFLNAEIPQRTASSIYDALTRLYKKEATVRAISKCNIHTFPNPPIESFTVVYNRNAVWAKPLSRGIRQTQHDRINHILKTYGLRIDRHVKWNDSQDAITIRSRIPVNIAAIANEFYTMDGVEGIDLGVPKVAGNDIHIRSIPGGWEIDYLLLFNPLSSDKTKFHIWKYCAYKDGRVKMIGESGHPLPDWMRCQVEFAEVNPGFRSFR